MASACATRWGRPATAPWRQVDRVEVDGASLDPQHGVQHPAGLGAARAREVDVGALADRVAAEDGVAETVSVGLDEVGPEDVVHPGRLREVRRLVGPPAARGVAVHLVEADDVGVPGSDLLRDGREPDGSEPADAVVDVELQDVHDPRRPEGALPGAGDGGDLERCAHLGGRGPRVVPPCVDGVSDGAVGDDRGELERPVRGARREHAERPRADADGGATTTATATALTQATRRGTPGSLGSGRR